MKPCVRFSRPDAQVAHAAEAAGFDKPGYLQLTKLWPHAGKSKFSVLGRFEITDVDGMTKAACDAAADGYNVFIEPRTFRFATRKGAKRGNVDEAALVFALVIDEDTDNGKPATLNGLKPFMVIETSPAIFTIGLRSSRRCDRSLRMTSANVSALMSAVTPAPGAFTQPFRIPGPPNFPTKDKIERGRTIVPTRLVETAVEARYSAADLDRMCPEITKGKPRSAPKPKVPKGVWKVIGLAPPSAMVKPKTKTRTKMVDLAPRQPGRHVVPVEVPIDLPDTASRSELERLAAEPMPDKGRRSSIFYRIVCQAFREGWTEEDVEALFMQFPRGCANKYEGRLRVQIEKCFEKRHQIEARLDAAFAKAAEGCRQAQEEAEGESEATADDEPAPMPALRPTMSPAASALPAPPIRRCPCRCSRRCLRLRRIRWTPSGSSWRGL